MLFGVQKQTCTLTRFYGKKYSDGRHWNDTKLGIRIDLRLTAKSTLIRKVNLKKKKMFIVVF